MKTFAHIMYVFCFILIVFTATMFAVCIMKGEYLLAGVNLILCLVNINSFRMLTNAGW